MNANILPVVDTHKINSGLQHAFTLSIVLANDKIIEWYDENYILPIMFEFSGDTLASSGEYLDAYAYSDVSAYKDIFAQHGYSDKFISSDSLIEIIKDFIDNKKYVILFVDEYYLPKCTLGGKTHFLHEEMIYGYDDNLSMFYSLGINTNGKYSTIKHGYDEISYAYKMGLGCSNHANIRWARENRVITLEILKKDVAFKSSSKNILTSIRRYIYPYFSNVERYKLFSPVTKEIYLGIDCYKLMSRMLTQSKDIFMLANLICEHNKIMADHLSVLNLEKQLIDEFYITIVHMSEKMRILSLKRMYLKSSNDKQRVNDRLGQMINDLYLSEMKFYNKIFDRMETGYVY